MKLIKDNDFKNYTLIVTGAAGFIGFHTARYLLEQGANVTGIDNLNDYYDPSLKQARLDLLNAYPNFSFHKLDISDKEILLDVFKQVQPDFVIHLAAQAGVRYCIDNPDAYGQSNLIGHLNMLEAVRQYPVQHLVYASSSSVYGDITQMPFSVQMKTDTPVSLYAATKKSCELLSYSYADMYDIYQTGLRFFTVYGPYGRPDMAYFKFTQKIINQQEIEIYNYGDMRRDFTYIDDIVLGIIEALKLPKPTEKTPHHVFNIGNHQPEELSKLVHLLEENLGQKAIQKLLPMQVGDVQATYADIHDLMSCTNFKPITSLETGIKHFIAWYKQYYGLDI